MEDYGNTPVRLDVRGIRVSYGGDDTVKGVSFTVGPGTLTGIVGPNGSGKSTLLKAVTKVIRPREGRVLLDESDVAAMGRKQLALRVAVVEQDTDVPFDFTVDEVVSLGRLPHQSLFSGNSGEDRVVVDGAVDLVGVRHLLDRGIKRLSGGERQRVMLAKALAQDTDVLLLDEPTSHLDIGNQLEVMDLVRGLCRDRGITVIAVLHDLNLASQYCDSIIVMKDGLIHRHGTPQEVITEGTIRSVYGARVRVETGSATGKPYVMLLPAGAARGNGNEGALRVHVVCGGGSGAELLPSLVSAGHTVTAGVLNLLDSDAEAAGALGLDTVLEAPFSGISGDRLKDCGRLVDSADAVVLAPTPFGAGNLGNLRLVAEAREAGKPVFLLEPEGLGDRDFTGGEAQPILGWLKEHGSTVHATVDGLLAGLDSIR